MEAVDFGVRRTIGKKRPHSSLLRPHADILRLIAWLLTEEADWVAGQMWLVDGGLAHLRPRPKAGGREAKNAAEPNAAV